MKKFRYGFFCTIVLASFLVPVSSSNAQITVEANIAAGVTVVDELAWAAGPSVLEDWGKTMGGAYAQVWFSPVDKIQVGGEIGYAYLFWYDFRVFGFSFNRTVNVDATKLMGLVRVDLTSFLFFEGGAGLYLFGDFSDLAVAAGLGLRLPINDNIYIPLKIRTDVILDADATAIPVGLHGGIGYRF